MPKIRPIRTAEEAKNVDPNEDMIVELPEDGVVELNDNTNLPEPHEQVIKVAEHTRKKATRKDEEDEATKELKQQLEDMRQAVAETKKQAEEATRRERDAVDLAQRRNEELRQSTGRAEDAEYDAVLNAIGAAESEVESGTKELEYAVEQSDARKMAEANRKIARAESRIGQLEEGKRILEHRKLAAKDRVEPDQRRAPATPQEYIDQLPNLMPAQRDWLKSHPELVTDTRKNAKLQAAHFDAEDEGFAPGSKRYFDFLEQRLGYKKVEDDDDEEEERPRRRPVTTAPPSRSTPSATTGKTSSTRITLTPKQREAARDSGVDEITYAKGLLKLQAMKEEGHYNE